MQKESPLGALSKLSAQSLGVFRGQNAVELGVSRRHLTALIGRGLIARELPDTYRMTAVPRSRQQRLRAALLWAGDDAAAIGRSSGELYRVEGVWAPRPEIVVPCSRTLRSAHVHVRQSDDRAALMLRTVNGVRTAGVEATLLSLVASLDGEALEIACEDTRRRGLTSVPALNAYLKQFGRRGRRGMCALRELVGDLDPHHASRSTLEVKARRLLVARGFAGFAREFPLEWNGKEYRYDFAFEAERTILETNGRRWHDDPADYEHDNEKWSVPGRYGYRVIFATWAKVTRHPDELVAELEATLAA
jgi:very-short-patch-repair endonuclease